MKFTSLMFRGFGYINPLDMNQFKSCGNIGTIDFECYVEPTTKKFIPYCAALYTEKFNCTTYLGDSYKFLFKRKSRVLSDLVLILLFRLFTFMEEMGIKEFIVYAHNFSGFDSYFIIKSLAGFGLKTNILKIDSNIYFVRVKYKRRVIEFRCSLLLLKSSLDECAQSFGVEERKIPFNHEWVQFDRLNYKGITPEGFIGNGEFVFKDYAMKYCLNDCLVLFKVLEVFGNKISEFSVPLGVRSYSIPGLAYRVFKAKFLKDKTLVNLSFNKNINDFIREGYYGGRTEVFMGYIGDNKGYYYDVKGMYAQAMCKSLPCGIPERISKFTSTWLNSKMSKGFYKVSVKSPEMHIPVLPFRTQEGKLIFPTGNWVGTYYSEELLLAEEYGYSFRPIEAIIFKDSKPFLKEYVEYFTKIKEMGGAYRQIGKLFINSLYGRFAIKSHNIETVLIHNREEDYFIKRFNIIDRVEIGDFILLTYDIQPILSHYKANEIFDLYLKDRESYRRKLIFGESNVAISAAIASLGRIHLYRDMMSVIKGGGKIAYCDTDSIFAEFTSSPLGLKHGNVYWDDTNPLTTFKEGIFLAPKMYSISRRGSHVKGVKFGVVSHEELRDSLFNKKELLEVSVINQFRKRDYNIYLDSLQKIYSLWRTDKREWIKDKNNIMVTTPLRVNEKFNPLKDYKLPVQDIEVKTPDLLFDFKSVNERVPTFVYSQNLISGIRIVISEKYLNISVAAHAENLYELYYILMGKLSLEPKPIYLKVLYKTLHNQIYTLTRYIYSPHINFLLSLKDFLNFIKTLIDNTHIRYDIKEMGIIILSLYYTEEGIKDLVNYQTLDPLPEDLLKTVSLRSVEEMRENELKLEDEIKTIKRNRIALIDGLSDSIKKNKISTMLEEVVNRSNILNKLDLDPKVIKSYFISALIQAKIEVRDLSIQKALKYFLLKFGSVKMDLDLFIIRCKMFILLLRELAGEDIIKLSKVSLYSAYYITFVMKEYEDDVIDLYYDKKIFFKELEKINEIDVLRILESTPIALNYEYLDWLEKIIELVEQNKVDRVKFGFSPSILSFKGELLTIKEGLRHYKYIKKILHNKNYKHFYMCWTTDWRWRLYPALMNFSVQSMGVIRWGFKNTPSIITNWTKDALFSCHEYHEYLIKIATKLISPEIENMTFELAVDLIKEFEINGSFDDYEVYLRKLEINRVLIDGKVEINPIPIDGQANVYQHTVGITRNEDIGKYVNIGEKVLNIDIYEWCANLFKIKLKESLKFTTLLDIKINLRKFIKKPIMTYPYGLTLWGLSKQILEFLDELDIKIEKEELKYYRDLIDSIRKEYLSDVLVLKNFLTTVIKGCEKIIWTLPDGFTVHQQYYKGQKIDISTTFNRVKMETRVLYVSDKINTKEHLQGITPNFIHSYDAYHMRQIIRTAYHYKIPVFPIHDSILVDLVNLTKAKIIVCDTFNKIYENPEDILKAFYISIRKHNPHMKEIEDIDLMIKEIVGSKPIKANIDLFRI